jgi:hypothetical protein
MLLAFTSQTGVLAIPLSLILFIFLNRHVSLKWLRRSLKVFSFAAFYLLVCFVITPVIAGWGGRVRLPLSANDNTPLGPRHIGYVLLNRNYCRPQLHDALLITSRRLRITHPQAQIVYLDAGFPLGGGLPMLPHLSHGDGRKADLVFIYTDQRDLFAWGRTPAPFGYGSFESPEGNEENTVASCLKENRWYSSTSVWRIGMNRSLKLHKGLTRNMILILARNPEVTRMFLEPHLKLRLGLKDVQKIRFHGCHAVRHDDHVHVEVGQ